MSVAWNKWSARRLKDLLPHRTPDMAVLFIDPDVASVEPLARALQRISAVAMAPTWQAAKTAISAHIPDLIVLELDLPDAQGLEVIASVHGLSTLRHVLFLVVTGRAGLRDKIAAFEAGADDYLVKPITPERFALHVQRLSRFRQVLSG